VLGRGKLTAPDRPGVRAGIRRPPLMDGRIRQAAATPTRRQLRPDNLIGTPRSPTDPCQPVAGRFRWKEMPADTAARQDRRSRGWARTLFSAARRSGNSSRSRGKRTAAASASRPSRASPLPAAASIRSSRRLWPLHRLRVHRPSCRLQRGPGIAMRDSHPSRAGAEHQRRFRRPSRRPAPAMPGRYRWSGRAVGRRPAFPRSPRRSTAGARKPRGPAC